MSSPKEEPQRVSRWTRRPGTPGPVSTSERELPDWTSVQGSVSDPNHRLTSVDLATSPWIESETAQSIYDDDADTRQLLGSTRSRSSSTSSASSEASANIPQGRIQLFLGSVLGWIACFTNLAVTRKVLDPIEHLDAKIKAVQARSRFHGWRMGILFYCCISATILLFNITVVIYVAVKTGFNGDSAVLPFSYDSPKMARIYSGIHILINGLSTILLAASNYTMQVLTSPTRTDLDIAHSKGDWFDIGVLSTHNLRRIPRKQLLFCVVMGLTSIPLHLFYNSAAIYIASTNHYQWNALNSSSTEWLEISASSSYAALGYLEWKDAYLSDLVQYGDLFLAIDQVLGGENSEPMTPPSDLNMTWFQNRTGFPPTSPGRRGAHEPKEVFLDLTTLFDQSQTGNVTALRIIDSRATIVRTRSRIQISLRFMIIVIGCNAVKLAMMLWVLFRQRSHFIVTLGDGAASFLKSPDPNTEGLCVFSKDAINTMVGPRNDKDGKGDTLGEILNETYGIWNRRSHKYSTALDRDRELGSSFIAIVLGLTPIFILVLGFNHFIDGHWGSSSTTVLGSSDRNNPQNTVILAWAANIPQLVLSFCYLAINSECTSMAGAHEWNQLGAVRKGLRVTQPLQHQRSKYFLQLPYKISLPLTLYSGGLHWLLSQSLFLVRIDSYDRHGALALTMSLDDDDDQDRARMPPKSGIVISGLGFVVLYLAFLFLVLIATLFGRRKLRSTIPFAAGCSLVISAACHPPNDDKEAHLHPVRWGVVKEKMFYRKPHCTLSSQKVRRPKEGNVYR